VEVTAVAGTVKDGCVADAIALDSAVADTPLPRKTSDGVGAGRFAGPAVEDKV
jgi:hypothetical protein